MWDTKKENKGEEARETLSHSNGSAYEQEDFWKNKGNILQIGYCGHMIWNWMLVHRTVFSDDKLAVWAEVSERMEKGVNVGWVESVETMNYDRLKTGWLL